MVEKKLTPKQARFVDEYLVDLNATKAAFRAGYSPRSAGRIAFHNLARPEIAARIDEAKKARAARRGIVADRVIDEIAKVAFADIREILDDEGNLKRLADMPADAAASIGSIEQITRSAADGEVVCAQKIRPWDKVRALELLCRHLGLLTDKVHVSGDLSARILAARKRVRDEN